MTRYYRYFFLLAFIVVSAVPAWGKTLIVEGKLDGVVTVKKHITFSVDQTLSRFTYQFSVPSTYNAAGNIQRLDDFQVIATPEPTESTETTDQYGNRSRKLIWRKLQSDAQISISYTTGITATISPRTSRAPFPLQTVPEPERIFLKKSKLVQSESPQITELARDLTEGITTEHQAVSAILTHVADAITYQYNPKSYDALYGLSTGTGNCQNFSHLAVALLRASGIPARISIGQTLKDKWKIPLDNRGSSLVQGLGEGLHAWIEVWYPDLGWLPCDPQMSRLFTSTRHVKFGHGLDADDVLEYWSGAPVVPQMNEVLEAKYSTDTVSLRLQEALDQPTSYILAGPVTAIALARNEPPVILPKPVPVPVPSILPPLKPEPLPAKPVTPAKEEPPVIKPKPVPPPRLPAPKPQRGKHKPQPVKPKPQPAKPEPLPVKPEPLPVKPEPLPVKPEPLPVKPEPLPAKPVTLAKEEPPVIPPKPVPQPPVPVAKPQPVKPEPLPAKPVTLAKEEPPVIKPMPVPPPRLPAPAPQPVKPEPLPAKPVPLAKEEPPIISPKPVPQPPVPVAKPQPVKPEPLPAKPVTLAKEEPPIISPKPVPQPPVPVAKPQPVTPEPLPAKPVTLAREEPPVIPPKPVPQPLVPVPKPQPVKPEPLPVKPVMLAKEEPPVIPSPPVPQPSPPSHKRVKPVPVKPKPGTPVELGNMDFPSLMETYRVDGGVGHRSFDRETAEYATSKYLYAQAFTLDTPLDLKDASLAMRKFGGDGSVYIDVVRDEDGKPSLDGVRSMPVSLEEITRKPGYYWVNFPLPENTNLAPGKYWLVLRHSGEAIMNWFYTPGKRVNGPDDSRSTVQGWQWEDVLSGEFVYRVRGVVTR